MFIYKLVLCLLLLSSGHLALELDEVCDSSRLPYSSNPLEYDYNRCDPQQGLYCNTYSRCECYVVDSYYDYYHGRCLGKIGYPCQASPTFKIGCGDWAECEPVTGFCRCREGYTSNYDRRGCSGSQRVTSFGVLFLMGLIIVGKVSGF